MLPQPALRVAVHPGSILQMARVAGQTLATERNALIQALKLLGAVIPYSRNSEIFGEDEPVEYVYRVESGSVRTYKIFTDGRRQIVRFYLPGDIFGIELADKHTLSAEAIVDAKILAVKRSALTALAGRDPTISVELIALTGRELQRVRDRIGELIVASGIVANKTESTLFVREGKRRPGAVTHSCPVRRCERDHCEARLM